ncbi:MAG: hypothetical protein MJ147_02965 [Clostridia bacterium]|nr:hypothetical protein [Clostridia bacterium]
MKERCKKKYDFNDSFVYERLISFFKSHGLTVLFEKVDLYSLKRNNDEIDYFIAQFIIENSQDETLEFDYLINMVKGFFVSNAISLQIDNNDLYKSNFKNVKVFLDTTFLIYALGFKLEESKNCSLEILKMLTDSNAELCCFFHNYEEVKSILIAYRNNIKNPRKFKSCKTLEFFDINKYSVDDVDDVINTLEEKINKLGISIEERPSYPSNEEEIKKNGDALIDYLGLKEYIKNLRPNYLEPNLETDISTAFSVKYLRHGKKAKKIENCIAFFITTNDFLVRAVNYYCTDNKNEIELFFSEKDIASIMWIKHFKTNIDFPKHQLIENAISALEPTESLIQQFYEKVQKLEKEGGITVEEAAILRLDRFAKKELMNRTYGDADFLEENTIFEILDEQKKSQTIVQNEIISNLTKKMELDDEDKRKRKERIMIKIQEDITNKNNRLFDAIKWIVRILFICVFVFSIYYTVIGFVNNYDIHSKFLSIASLILSIVSNIDLFFGNIGFLSKILGNIKLKHYYKKLEKAKENARYYEVDLD